MESNVGNTEQPRSWAWSQRRVRVGDGGFTQSKTPDPCFICRKPFTNKFRAVPFVFPRLFSPRLYVSKIPV